MLITLSSPFSNNWRKGYLSTNNQNRQIVALYNSADDRKTISYARYLKSVELGYEISEGFEVDHKDDNKFNDAPGNLQVLTKKQNLEKDNLKRESKYKGCTLICCNCGISYNLTPEQERSKVLNKTELNFCSTSCSGKYHYKRNEPPTKKTDITLFEEKVRSMRAEGYSDRKINQLTGITRHSLRLVK